MHHIKTLKMIDIDSARRNYHSGPYDSAPMVPHLPLGMPSGGTPLMDNHLALVHWNQTIRHQPPAGIKPTTDNTKSDEDDDDDDEDRPFTPPPPRERLSYTRYQLELLNAIYCEVRYPNSTQKQLIAKRVGITREQVKIWFQNRRRKDVVGNSGKAKSVETSPGSTCSMDSKDSEQQNSPIADSSGNTSSEENSQSNDSDEKVVPSVVLKSVINELLKFVNDPLKGKRKKKKSRSKREKEKAELKKGLAQTLLTGGYDMISPPNQITPTAFFEKAKRGFSHSKGSSAFANPRDLSKPAVISNLHNTTGATTDSKQFNATTASGTIGRPGNGGLYGDQLNLPVHGQQHFTRVPNPNNLPHMPGSSGYDMAVMPDLHSYLDTRQKELMQAQNHHYPPMFPPPSLNQIPRQNFEKNLHTLSNLNPGRPLNGIFPFPFMAEHPLFLSSLRHPDQILRPSPHYPGSSTSDDPYQPLLVTSLPNPYFSSPPTSWSGQTLPPTSSSYTQL